MTAASPGVIALFANTYYPSREEYLGALVEAMRDEYRAIVEAGLILQLDCPDFAMACHTTATGPAGDRGVPPAAGAVRRGAEPAVAGLDPARIRLHLCWSNTESPHIHDVELSDILDIVLRGRPAGLVLEAATRATATSGALRGGGPPRGQVPRRRGDRHHDELRRAPRARRPTDHQLPAPRRRRARSWPGPTAASAPSPDATASPLASPGRSSPRSLPAPSSPASGADLGAADGWERGPGAPDDVPCWKPVRPRRQPRWP